MFKIGRRWVSDAFLSKARVLSLWRLKTVATVPRSCIQSTVVQPGWPVVNFSCRGELRILLYARIIRSVVYRFAYGGLPGCCRDVHSATGEGEGGGGGGGHRCTSTFSSSAPLPPYPPRPLSPLPLPNRKQRRPADSSANADRNQIRVFNRQTDRQTRSNSTNTHAYTHIQGTNATKTSRAELTPRFNRTTNYRRIYYAFPLFSHSVYVTEISQQRYLEKQQNSATWKRKYEHERRTNNSTNQLYWWILRINIILWKPVDTLSYCEYVCP